MGRKIEWHRLPMPCLICGVDSFPIKVFLATFIGSLVIASIAIFVWAKLTGRTGDDKKSSRMAIEADRRE